MKEYTSRLEVKYINENYILHLLVYKFKSEYKVLVMDLLFSLVYLVQQIVSRLFCLEFTLT